MGQGKKVFVAMSGGVDSSVAAALLVEQGNEVVGITMQIWDPGVTEAGGEEVGCCSLAAVNDARRVADMLNIPHYVMNFRSEFEEKVIDYFTAEYLSGRTPNPCIACNRHIKFDSLLQKVKALGADCLATGHYARLIYNDTTGRFLVKRSKDRKKDQTYVLYNLTQAQLARTLMPLGEYTKEQVRRMAAARGLPVAEKEESQEICFVVDNDYGSFIAGKAGGDIKPGPFLDKTGNTIGVHRGISYYTVGQRRGLGIAAGRRLYVVGIDPPRNAVILGDEDDLFVPGLEAGDNNFIPFDSLLQRESVQVQIRYNATPVPAEIFPEADGKVRVKFEQPQRAVAPGQAVVYYIDDLLIGGGVIRRSLTGNNDA